MAEAITRLSAIENNPKVVRSRTDRSTTVVCATDLSQRAQDAEQRAALVARRIDARLVLLHVVDPAQPVRAMRRKIARARLVLETRVRELAGMGYSATAMVRVGKPYRAIANVATELHADLIVLGPYRRRPGDSILGTTAEQIIGKALRPVLIVNTAPRRPYGNVLLTADRSGVFAGVMRMTEKLGLLEGANASIVQALEPAMRTSLLVAGVSQRQVDEYVRSAKQSSAETLARQLDSVGLDPSRFRIIHRITSPFRAIDDAAAGTRSDLVVVGASRFPRLKRMLLGSVSNEVQRNLARDVLVVSSGAMRRALEPLVSCGEPRQAA
jgi:universal stress protein E